MTNDEMGTQDPQELEQDIEVSEDNNDLEDLDQETLKEKLLEERKRSKTLDAQRKHFKEKFEKASEKKEEIQSPSEDTDTSMEKRLSELEMERKKREFGHHHGLSPEETDTAFRFNPKDPKQSLEHPFFKAGLEATRSQKRAESATPSTSKRSAVVNGKSYEEMTPDERKEHYSKVLSSKARG